jgi:hypothetical protein
MQRFIKRTFLVGVLVNVFLLGTHAVKRYTSWWDLPRFEYLLIWGPLLLSPVALIAAVGAAYRGVESRALAVFVSILIAPLFALPAVALGDHWQVARFEALAQRATPLMRAFDAACQTNWMAVSTTQALVPDWIEALPSDLQGLKIYNLMNGHTANLGFVEARGLLGLAGFFYASPSQFYMATDQEVLSEAQGWVLVTAPGLGLFEG